MTKHYDTTFIHTKPDVTKHYDTTFIHTKPDVSKHYDSQHCIQKKPDGD